MSRVRTRMGDGCVTELTTAVPGARKGIEAKRNIAELLDVDVPCLKRS